MEILSSIGGDKHEFCLVVNKLKHVQFPKHSHHSYMTAYSEVAQIFCQGEQT